MLVAPLQSSCTLVPYPGFCPMTAQVCSSRPSVRYLQLRAHVSFHCAQGRALLQKNMGRPLAWEHQALTAAVMARREAAANCLCVKRTNGGPTLASGWAGRAKANTSYDTESSARSHSTVKRSSPRYT